MKKMANLLIILSILMIDRALCEPISANPYALKVHVSFLSKLRPARNIDNLKSLNKASQYIENQFRLYTTRVGYQEYSVTEGAVRNIFASFGPDEGPRIIIGAHYDVAGNQPGADDNASGISGLIELARLLSSIPDSIDKRIDLVAYTLEEPPYFRTEKMGSHVHARSLYDQGEDIELMIALEMIGFYTDEPGTQLFPDGVDRMLFPDTGNFIAIISNFDTHPVAFEFFSEMQKYCSVPIEYLTAPPSIPGVDFSDHLNFWHLGYKAIMITDTAFLRNKNYHLKSDRPETLNYSKISEVINGIFHAISR